MGIGFGYVGYNSASNTIGILKDGIRVNATVKRLEFSRTNGSGNFFPVFEYQVNGQTYIERSDTGSNPSKYVDGQPLTLTVNPKYPAQFLAPDLMSQFGNSLILFALSFVFSLVGGWSFYAMVTNSNKKKWLSTNGMVVVAKVISVGLDNSIEVNGKSPYRIRAQWQDPATKVVHLFKSDMIWFDPAEFVSATIEVKIDRNNPKVHDIVLSKIPKAA